MRNAAAQLDDDFAFDEPARRQKASRKPTAGSAKKRSSTRLRKSRGRYMHYVAIGLSASLAIGIMVNALALQHSRHPAPLFGKAIQLGAQPAPGAVSTAPEPMTTAKVSGDTASLPPMPVSPPHATPLSVQRSHHGEASPAPKAKGDDLIAKLLKTGSPPAKDNEKAKDAEKAKDKDNAKTVLATQHALVKLGFVVKANGNYGPSTRTAIEAFERDQHMPVKGEMSRKVLKQLSAESGVAID